MLKIVMTSSMKNDPEKYVRECESEYSERISAASAEILKRGTRFITLSGPSCSGKTTAARRIADQLSRDGRDVRIISIDNFFRSREKGREAEMVSGEKIDYDSVDALDLERLADFSNKIEHGQPAEVPHFDFASGKSLAGEKITPKSNSMFIYEGIQAIYPELYPLYGENPFGIFTSVEQDVECSDIFIGRRDIRLIRRIVRDHKFRGTSCKFSFFIWRSVLMNEEKNINPHIGCADLTLDSLLPYEIFVMGSELLPLLAEIPEGSIYYPKALELQEKVKTLASWPTAIVPKDSILREFLGQN